MNSLDNRLSLLGVCLSAFVVCLICPVAPAQTNEWVWMGGSNTISNSASGGQLGVYGTFRVPARSNTPGGRQQASSWTDNNGNFWLFGGFGFASNGSGDLNDLWERNAFTGEWAWMSGSSDFSNGNYGSPGVYGSLGVPNVRNVPGGRRGASGAVDHNGKIWLFGGLGYGDVVYEPADYNQNDLWEFDPSTNQWTWLSGGEIRR